MLKFKTFLTLTIILVFSFSLVGCGLLTSRSAEPVEEVSDGELPEWLLLAYRADDSDVAEKNETPGDVKEPPAETTQSAATTQPATTATQPTSGSTAPAKTTTASTTLEDEIEDRMNDILREIYAEEIAAEKKRLELLAKEAEKEKEDEGRGYDNWFKN